MTELTKQMNIQLGEDAKWLHAFTGARYEEEHGCKTGSMIPTGLDLTHTNSYGAKMHAWLISEAETDLKAFSKRRPMPEMREELENARNKNYHISLLLDLRFGIICMSMKIKRIFSEITWQPEPYELQGYISKNITGISQITRKQLFFLEIFE